MIFDVNNNNNNNKGKKEDEDYEDILFWGFVYSYSGVRVWVSIYLS